MDKLRSARFLAMNTAPYLAHALTAMPLIESEDLPFVTMGVDRWGRLFYHPRVVDRSPQELVVFLIHEVLHLLHGHWERQGARDARVVVTTEEGPKEVLLWNIACDLAINPTVTELVGWREEKLLFPEQFDLPEKLTAEEYYELLLEKVPPLPSFPCGLPDPNATKGNGPRLSRAERELLRRRVAQEVRKHKSRGTVPEGILRWAERVLHPPVDPRELLKGAVGTELARASLGKVDYWWKRPSRKESVLRGARLPGMVTPLPRVAVGVDTSGSMSERELGEALAILKGVLREVEEVVFIAGDAEPHVVERIRDWKKARLVGGGGTDMGEVLNAMAKVRPPVDLGIVITDGYTPWPKKTPPFPVIVVLTDREGESPGWARTVLLRRRDEEATA